MSEEQIETLATYFNMEPSGITAVPSTVELKASITATNALVTTGFTDAAFAAVEA